MNTQTRRPRSKRTNGFFVPAFENIVNEMMNTSLKDLQTEGKTQFSKPQANIRQTEEGYKLELALPGFGKEDVEIKVDKDALVISSTKENTDEVNFRLREFNYGGFERRFRLDETIDKSSIAASFEHGVLTITLSKIKPEPAKTIKIS